MSKFIKILVIGNFISIPRFLYSVTVENMEVIWERTTGDSLIVNYGMCMGCAGDVNNDGFDDMMIFGDTIRVWGDTVIACVWIYYGGPTFDTICDVRLSCGLDYAVPREVSTLGDINGDGYDDIIVGKSGTNNVYIFFGGSPMDTVVDLVLNPPDTTSQWFPSFGCSVSGEGDINGDGYPDFVIGAYTANYRGGRVYVYFGGPLLDTIPDVILQGYGDEGLGMSVDCQGDMNNDGYADIIVGADQNDEGGGDAGKIYVFFGGNPMDTIPDTWIRGESGGENLGWFGVSSVINIGDYDWVVAGSRFWSDTPTYGRGKVYILFGGNPMDTIVDIELIGKTDSSQFGQDVCGHGHINTYNDSCGDILIGALEGYNVNPGAGYFYLGNPSMDTVYDAKISGEGVGWEVASAGDVDGDGKDEMMFSQFVDWYKQKVWVCKYTGPGIEEKLNIKNQIAKIEVYPNPVIDVATIRYGIPVEGMVSIKIYDISGREVKRLVDKKLKSGSYTTVWAGTDGKGKLVSSGVYVYKLKVKNEKLKIEKEKKMLFLGRREKR